MLRRVLHPVPGMELRRFVYILESVADPRRRYVGLTSDVTRRLVAHNTGQSPHTASHRPWRLLVAIAFADETHAIRFEKFLKSGSGRAFATHHFG